MNRTKKIIPLLITICILASNYTFCLSADAVTPPDENNYINIYKDYFDTYGYNTEVRWSGKTTMKENTIYYVDRKISVSVIRNVPKTSMLVVKNGGHITVKSTGALYSQGHLAVEEGGIIEVDKSKLVINSGSIAAVNGSLYINEKSEMKIYSYFYLYRNGLFSLNGLITVYKNGRLFCANDIRIYDEGAIKGSRIRITGLSNDRVKLNAAVREGAYMRFYDRQNHKTYVIRNRKIIDKICETLNKITLIPVYESMPFDGQFENRYGIRLFDVDGDDYFYFERPVNEKDGLVYMDGVTYIYPDTGMTFDEFYYYALGVKDYAKR